ncbi:hypothetical protein [Legionella longbeachae]|uniref:Uncharacterized protein n=1 Tax=Legionella longbeachae serogroup 1 (strain NSW150) TaxID=661367 RepID=D3HJI4_LEGLN|nr:hypothetical protein [Legionella longbeachae]VEE03113.1 Uncharacterised protein [Legionella oakridgensis]HBD7399232.1 hypothetical protein [Legionella pneumophila]ARB93987.1 hypothetical protein A6J40_18150 [Legionella longbeachae]ARM32875.1 hypothetical protein B0B39_04800 [Legionella longbeachae]EEZ94314.1 conserved hypothetical protein [Legionella longbeachae D-4968]
MKDKTKGVSKKNTATKTDRFIETMNKIEKQSKNNPAIEKKFKSTEIYDNLVEIEPNIDDELERYFKDEESNSNKSLNQK